MYTNTSVSVIDSQPKYFCGIDVQIQRGCCFYIIDEQGLYVDSGWSEGNTLPTIVYSLHSAVMKICGGDKSLLAIGIDAPRMALPENRKFYWGGKRNKWRNRNAGDRGYGRHCEIIINSFKLANPQWTPTSDNVPEWMKLGFELFKKFDSFPYLYEAFPSASYSVLEGISDVKVELSFKDFKKGPKDMLDASVAAVTVKEFLQGRGSEVGGGDGLGTIILPTKLGALDARVMNWPETI